MVIVFVSLAVVGTVGFFAYRFRLPRERVSEISEYHDSLDALERIDDREHGA
jgi:hypothetical protein